MSADIWLCLNSSERTLLREALAAYAVHGNVEAANMLSKRIVQAPPHPDITIGVHGGVVQWIMGNPFPIRICDYDGDEQELPAVDERGQRCAMGFEKPDAALGSNAN